MRKVKDADTRRIKIKVSGLARLCDVEWINRMKPDYAAFIFFNSSYRVGVDQAEYLRKKLAPEIQTVGSFSCLSCWLIADLLGSGMIDAAHIHGDCTPEEMEQLRRLTDKPLIKTVYIESPESIRKAQDYPVDYLMYDFREEEGKSRDQCLNILLSYGPQKREFFLSDRLCSTNLKETLLSIRPYGINFNGPIEKRRKRDPAQIQKMVREIREMELS
ncbi:MAG TPA: hypothetical protein IAA57_05035 [Candidatus Pullilachnospira intestinigallinarum]|nr:hypothetical protein [Candidatus Pullilachnospira intestinigallinarum]